MEGITPESTHAVQEEAIATCVQEFYRKAREDSLLGPIFNAKVDDWDVHLRLSRISGRGLFLARIATTARLSSCI